MILRELFVKLGLDIDLQSFTSASSTVEKLGEAVVNLAAQFVEQVQRIADSTEEIDGLAQSAGVTTDALQRMGKAAALEGMGLDALAHNLVILDRNIGKVGHGAKTTEEAFTALVEEFSALPDGVKKTQRAIDLFGRGGAEMIQVLNNGQEAIEAMRSASIMSPAQIAAGKELIKIQRQLAAQTTGLWRDAVAPLLPAITDLLKRWRDWKKENAEWIRQRIKDALGTTIAIVRGLGAAFSWTTAAIKRALPVLKVLGLMLGSAGLAYILGTLVTGLNLVGATMARTATASIAAAARTAAAWVAAAAPFLAIGAMVAGLYLLFDDVAAYQKSIERGGTGSKTIFGRFNNAIREWTKSQAEDPWWLTAIKKFVELLREAEELMVEMGISQRATNAKADRLAAMSARQKQAEIDRQNLAAARVRVQNGLPLTAAERESLGRARIPEAAFTAQARAVAPPTATPRVGAGTVLAPQFTAQIQFNGPVGDAQGVGTVLTQHLDQWWEGKWSGKMEPAHAATGGD